MWAGQGAAAQAAVPELSTRSAEGGHARAVHTEAGPRGMKPIASENAVLSRSGSPVDLVDPAAAAIAVAEIQGRGG